MEKAATHLKQNFKTYLEDLKKLVRIPSVSFPNFPETEVRKSANAVAALMEARGLENIQILELPGTHPYVYAERIRGADQPTLLLYAHHDVQPPGRKELWKSDPFEPALRAGPGGERLYGRGTADDKAGIVIHTSAIASFLAAAGELPVNVKIVIEGEEEIGSPHLPEFLKTYRSKLDADILVLTDTTNFDCGIPSLTIALRGMVALSLEVRALQGAVHSGMWGGPVPDPAIALSKMLAGLVDSHGRIAVPGVMEQVTPLSKSEKEEFKRIPRDEAEFRKQAGMVPQAELLLAPEFEGIHPAVQTWRWPSLTVNAIQASSRQQSGNIINDTAWARLTVRLVAGMDPKKVLAQLQDHLRKQTPWGLSVEFHAESASPSWSTVPEGAVFEAAKSALEKGYGKKPLMIGCGGSIPFVAPFAEALGGAPALLIGVEDPYTNAHGENESLLVSDLEKACLGQIHLFSEIARSWKK